MKRTLAWLLVSAALVIGLSPILALWMPARWRQHTYQEISFQFIANNALSKSSAPEDIIRAAMRYTRMHLWLVDNPRPYAGKPLDYLVEGIGWCDYQAKVFCRLLAAKGIHARYAFLKDAGGNSPHTIAEVYVRGRWRAIDPFLGLTYLDGNGEWAALEEVTPELVANLPELALLRSAQTDVDERILALSAQVFPLPQSPQRSDDFISDKNLFDWIADGYVTVGGSAFAWWYQDQYLRRQLAAIPDPVERLWQQARHYHLYRRHREAEPLYRRLLTLDASGRYRERAPLLLGRLLIRDKRFLEARQVLEAFQAQVPDRPWVHFQLALCAEGLGDAPGAIRELKQYQQLHGTKFAVKALRHLAKLLKET